LMTLGFWDDGRGRPKLDMDLRRVLHGEQEFEYLKPIYVGDVLTAVSTVENVFEKAGARGGTMTFGVTATELPNIKTELTRFRLWTDYAVQKNASLRLDVIYEDWKTNDWSYSFANGSPFLFGSATGQQVDGTFFTQPSPQQSTFVGLRYKYMLD